MKVLVVEDETHLADGLRFNLEAEGHHVDIDGDGQLALQRLLEDRAKYDAVILDVMLPGKNGFAVVKDLRNQEATSQLPILAVTAMTDDTVKDRVKQAGFDGLVQKPFEFKVLLAAVDRALKAAKKAA